jgi:DNA-binding IscR family transcriptional regulator
MLKLNRNIEVALQAAEFLKGKTKPVRLQDVAEAIGTTDNFIEQVARKLRVAGILTSVRGPGGGHLLNPEVKVTALAVAEALGYTPQIILGRSAADRLRANLTNAFVSTEV